MLFLAVFFYGCNYMIFWRLCCLHMWQFWMHLSMSLQFISKRNDFWLRSMFYLYLCVLVDYVSLIKWLEVKFFVLQGIQMICWHLVLFWIMYHLLWWIHFWLSVDVVYCICICRIVVVGFKHHEPQCLETFVRCMAVDSQVLDTGDRSSNNVHPNSCPLGS